MFKKILTIVLAFVFLLQEEMTVLAVNNLTGLERVSENVVLAEETDVEENIVPGTGYIIPEREEVSGIHAQEERPVVGTSAEAQQSSYRTASLPAIRHQGGYSTCWAFATLGCMEINLMKKGNPEMDLSELHLAYFAYHSAVDPLGGLEGDNYSYTGTGSSFLQKGGNDLYASNALMDWLGAASEETVPYSMATEVEKNGLPQEVAFDDIAYLQGVREINMSDRAGIKQAIVDYGSVQVNYYAKTSYTSNIYYNAQTSGYYCYDAKDANHAVIIVGWDDDYAASNFPTAPAGDGAWIVRNSWGSSYGEDGYFYLSYYDKSIYKVAVAFEAELSDLYDNNYQYDGSPFSTGSASGSKRKVANVFQTKANPEGAELIKAASFETFSVNAEYTISIYKNLTDLKNPESGEFCTSVTGNTTYAGIYTIALDAPVYVDEDVYYSVVVELSVPGGYAYIKEDKTSTGTFSAATDAKENQSFLFQNNKWMDYGYSYNTNYRIKAYTTNVDKQEAVPATNVTLDKTEVDIRVGESYQLTATVEPENAIDKAVIWSSSNETVATVSDTGLVKALKGGTAVITVQTTDGTKSASCLVNTKQPVTGIALNFTSFIIDLSETKQLSVTYYPSDATENMEVTWTSSNEEVATVDDNGLVTPVSAGTAIITAQVGEFTDTVTVTVEPIYVYSVEISAETDGMRVGDRMQLSAEVLPAEATDKTLTWSSNNEAVAIVDASGVVTAMGTGNVEITASACDGSGAYDLYTIVVWPQIFEVTDISLNKSELEINVGETYRLEATITPDNATDKEVEWTSSDETVVTVDSAGLISARKVGQATITATVGEHSASMTLIVNPVYATSVEFPTYIATVEEGETVQWIAKVYPDNATYPTVTWSSADETIAIVDESGKITGVKAGQTTVTAASKDEKASLERTITVTAKQQDIPSVVLNGMITEQGGKRYWYENGVKQGLEGRGKEVYDPESGAWYWLDSVLDGAVATSKDVYQESAAGDWADREDGTGKWVRYDENGHMIKGWSTNENGTYYFDETYGTMAKGDVVIDGKPCYFDPDNGIAADNQWISIGGVECWYEDGVRQGLEGRGKEIYDPVTNAWYWLDSVDMGKKAVSKDVYQESYSAYPDREDGTGKWVRYDENGYMIKGWQTTDHGTYYFEEITGAMAKGRVTINGIEYYFNEATGILE